MSDSCESQPSEVKVISNIESHMVPNRARVVFDWDNTLKVINKEKGKIESRVSPAFLSHLIEEKNCELFIISAIRPSKMNMDTLLLEVDRLGLREFFCHSHSGLEKGFGAKATNKTNFPWMHFGNIIICGYDKAEAFLSFITEDQVDYESGRPSDQVDSLKNDEITRPVVFFDDEAVNIENFSAIVKGSQCYKIT